MAKDAKNLHADNKDSNQPARIESLLGHMSKGTFFPNCGSFCLILSFIFIGFSCTI